MAVTQAPAPARPTTPGPSPRRVRDETRLCRTTGQRIWLIVALVSIVVVPMSVSSPFLLSLGATIGIYAIASIGLNILSGYAGQISLAQSVFVGIGGFAGVGFGSLLDLPLILWLPATAAAGGLIAALIAPLTLRLRGVFQIVLSLALLFIGTYVFLNVPALTGGNAGISATPSLSLGFVDFGHLQIGNQLYTRDQGLFILVWLCVAAAMIVTVNMQRTRFGRAMIAVREAETAAQVAGINVNGIKMKAFTIAGVLGGLAGGLLLAQIRYLQAEQFGITMGLTLLIIAVVGGLGTTWGPVVGAAIICSIPVLATQYGPSIPFLKADFGDGSEGFGIPVGQVSVLIYGLALVLVMLFEPRGASALIRSAREAALRPLRRLRQIRPNDVERAS